MKIAVWGLALSLGKKNLEDERLETLARFLKPQKITPISIELLDSSHLKDSDAFILKEDFKQDLILMDLERIEELILKEDNYKPILLRLKEILEREIFLNGVSFNLEEENLIHSLGLYTLKPCVFMKEEDITLIGERIKELYYRAKRICFFTSNEKELRAWEIKKGTTAYQASGLIHSDIQRGFIKAEVIGYDALIQAGGLSPAKGRGLVRLEDKDYIIQDGELIYFRFNV